MNSNKAALKSGIWYTIANFLTRSVSFLTTPIFTRLLSHEDYGSYNTYVSWLSILDVLVTLQLGSTFIRARYEYEEDFDCYVFSTLILSLLSAVIWVIFLNVFYDMAGNSLAIERRYFDVMIVYVGFNCAVTMYQLRERYFFKYKTSVFLSLLVTISTAVISILFVMLFSNRLDGRIYGSALPAIVVGVVLTLKLWSTGKRLKVVYWKYALPICLPFIPHLLSLTVLNSIDKIMITNICGKADTALYSVAYACGAMITILLTSMNSAYAPWLGEKLNENRVGEIRSFSKKYILIFFAFSLGIMCISPEILMIMGGKSYLRVKYVILPVSCGCMMQFIYTLFVNVEQFKKRTFGMAIASVMAAALNYALNSYFIPRSGYVAAAYTTLAGYAFLVVAHMILTSRIGGTNIYDYPFIIKMAGASICLTIMMNFLLDHTIYRVLFIIIYAGIAVWVFYKFGLREMLAKGLKKRGMKDV